MRDHKNFMNRALELSAKALEDGEFPVGCVIVWKGRIIAEGSRANSSENANEIDHAEILALRAILSSEDEVDLSEVIVYSTMEPCLMCFSTLLVNGVKSFVYGYEDAMGGGTGLQLEKLPPLYSEIELEVIPGVMRQECLEQFQTFFSNFKNTYLKGTYLAEYTLKQ